MTRALALLAAAGLLAGLAACGGNDGGGNGDGGGANATPTPGPGPLHAVRAADFAFQPNEFEVPAGVSVQFVYTNVGSADHTFTIYEDAAYTVKLPGGEAGGPATPTDEARVTFPRAGTYYFRCEFHPTEMRGQIVAR